MNTPAPAPRLRLAVMSVAAAALLVVGGRALASGTCARPASFLANWTGLNHFCADEPALASEMNANFATVVGWLEQKVGPVGTATLTLSGTPVNSGTIADGTIVGADLAPGAVSTRELADGGVTAAKLASRVAVYTVNAACPAAGALSGLPTCTEVITVTFCGTACSLSSPRYVQCDGSCGACGVIPNVNCPRPNSFVGYLVGP